MKRGGTEGAPLEAADTPLIGVTPMVSGTEEAGAAEDGAAEDGAADDGAPDDGVTGSLEQASMPRHASTHPRRINRAARRRR